MKSFLSARSITRCGATGPLVLLSLATLSVLTFAGCGRVGFESYPSDAGASDSSVDVAMDTIDADVSDLPQCANGVLDPGELEIDCGGPDCPACALVPTFHLDLGGRQSCFLLETGTIRCWGDGSHGRLGYGDTQTVGDDETPASKGDVNLGAVAVQVSTGGSHTCALTESGTVRCWGFNQDGQLGYASGANELIQDPADLGDVNVGGSVTQIVTGSSHTCALLSTGNVRCWGEGIDGRLGYGDTDDVGDDETPASKGDVNVGGTVAQIVAGQTHTCALLETGAVRCWGEGLDGKLGYSNEDNIGDSETPASAGDVNVGGTVTQLAAGAFHTCALLDTGNVRCWGRGQSGQLGYALGYITAINIGDDEDPATAGDVDIGGVVEQISAGGLHNCVRLSNDTVRCWGIGQYGRLGYVSEDNIGDDEEPAPSGDVDIGGAAVEVAAGGSHSCALLVSGAVRCWGDAANGRLGYSNLNPIGDNETPASAGDVTVE